MSRSTLPTEPLLGPVVLVGPPGAGKSTAGALAAAQLGLPFLDLDEEIARVAGQHADAIFSGEGETSFRVRESDALAAALDGRNLLIAAGAGVVDAAPNRERLARAHVVWLDVDDDTALARLGGARPWLPQTDSERRAAYRLREGRRRSLRANLAEARVDGRGPLPQVVAALADAIAHRPLPLATWQRDTIDGARVYDWSARPLEEVTTGGFVVVDAGVPQDVKGLRLPGGEAEKTTAGLERALRALAEAPRGAPIVAVGGGAFLDTVGAAAALLARGTPWIAVPSTPLAMADAGLGGKTAINLDDRKNLVGAFHAPQETRLWLGFLQTASAAQLQDGLAEALKHAWLTGQPLDDPRQPTAWVRQSVACKAGVVMRDPLEHGLRAALNLGHTVGHAIERVAGLSHGEAVRRGLLAALWLSEQLLGLDAAVGAFMKKSHTALGPLPPLELDATRALEALRFDKKGGRFVLLAALGRPVLATPPAALLPEALQVAARGLSGEA